MRYRNPTSTQHEGTRQRPIFRRRTVLLFPRLKSIFAVGLYGAPISPILADRVCVGGGLRPPRPPPTSSLGGGRGRGVDSDMILTVAGILARNPGKRPPSRSSMGPVACWPGPNTSPGSVSAGLESRRVGCCPGSIPGNSRPMGRVSTPPCPIIAPSVSARFPPVHLPAPLASQPPNAVMSLSGQTATRPAMSHPQNVRKKKSPFPLTPRRFACILPLVNVALRSVAMLTTPLHVLQTGRNTPFCMASRWQRSPPYPRTHP